MPERTLRMIGLNASTRHQRSRLLDHLIGGGEQRRRHVKAGRLCPRDLEVARHSPHPSITVWQEPAGPFHYRTWRATRLLFWSQRVVGFHECKTQPIEPGNTELVLGYRQQQDQCPRSYRQDWHHEHCIAGGQQPVLKTIATSCCWQLCCCVTSDGAFPTRSPVVTGSPAFTAR